MDAPREAEAGPPPCDGTNKPSEDACVIDEKFGVFVAPTGNDTTGSGTRAAPYKTIGKGLAQGKADTKRVYACAGIYAETVTIGVATDDAKLFGGFDCANWKYATTNRPFVQPASGTPLTITGLTLGAIIEDVEFDAPPTSSSTKGQNSIAAFVVSSQGVKLTRVKLVAQDAQPGADGVAPASNYDGTLTPDNATIAGHDATNATGGLQQDCASLCVNNVHSTGGKGGNGAPGADAGAPTKGDDGAPVIAPPQPSTATGKGGAPQPAPGSSCALGAPGSNAVAGTGGSGAAKAGTLTASGWTPLDGTTGITGNPAQGGGGGGAGISASKGGGGGGACGGCGGSGAAGGKGGGSSFALLSFQSAVVLEACTLAAGKGGNGGKGGDGQAGQVGGNGGIPASAGCSGGAGGMGGTGGGGGGAAAGLSVAIAYLGTAPAQTGAATTTTVAATTATGGPAGANGSPVATKGLDGVAQAVMDLGP
jgi:hypothetical protein